MTNTQCAEWEYSAARSHSKQGRRLDNCSCRHLGNKAFKPAPYLRYAQVCRSRISRPHTAESLESFHAWANTVSRSLAAKKKSKVLGHLEALAEAGNEVGFLSVLAALNWKTYSADECVTIMRLALEAGAIGAVESIASEAAKDHPDSTEVQRYARLYAPMRRVPSEHSGYRVDHAANRTWLEEHAGQYQNQWVAVRDGHLLATAPTAKQLVKELGDTKGILLTVGL